jgi:hypothetical protein
VNETRIGLYERLMKAQEQIARARYGRGIRHEAVLAAMDAAEARPSEAERREDLYISSLSAFVQALGGELEIHAVFPEETVVVNRSSAPSSD